jgi:hypothetical protein
MCHLPAAHYVNENKGLREGQSAALQIACSFFSLLNQWFSGRYERATRVGGLRSVFRDRSPPGDITVHHALAPGMIGADTPPKAPEAAKLPANPERISLKGNAMKALQPFAFAFILLSQPGPALAQHIPAASIPAADLIQPADLAAILKSAPAAKPLMLQVGFRTLYAQAHIPDSEYVGAAGDAAGLQALRNRVAQLGKDTAIVIYCGCCPWSRCPNIAAAYKALHALGFTQVKILYIAENFGDNWVNLGYPVMMGKK